MKKNNCDKESCSKEVEVKTESDLQDIINLKKLRKTFVKVAKKVVILKRIIYESLEHSLEEENKMADDLRIPVFDGKEYECWKKRIVMILKFKKCDIVITREKLETDKEDEWFTMNLKAMNYIYSGISNDQLQFVKDKETARGIIQQFDDMYLKKSTALQICVRNKLENLRLKDFEDSRAFFTDFEKLINDLKSAGADVSEQEKLSYMIKMLSSSLSYIGDLIDVLPKSEQTVEYVKSKIKMVELKEKEEGTKNNSSAFKSERKKDTCYKCGKYGHFIAECKDKGLNGNSWMRWRAATKRLETTTAAERLATTTAAAALAEWQVEAQVNIVEEAVGSEINKFNEMRKVMRVISMRK